jgi:hypothetical protein
MVSFSMIRASMRVPGNDEILQNEVTETQTSFSTNFGVPVQLL